MKFKCKEKRAPDILNIFILGRVQILDYLSRSTKSTYFVT